MSKKHFKAIAEVFKSEMASASPSEDAVLRRLAGEMARICAATNANFDRERFLTACGLDKVEEGGAR